MADWGRRMFVTPGVVVDGELVTNSLVDINLGLRILLGSSYYDDWADGSHEKFVDIDPLGNPIDVRHPWNQHTLPKPQKRDFSNAYSWTMSPRWFDGTDHLALDTGGGPIARLWSTALSGLVNTDYVQATGHSVKIQLPRTALKPATEYEWKIPRWSNAIERNRARTYFQAYAAALALHFCEKAMAEVRAGQTETWTPFKVPDDAISCGFTEAVRGVLSHHMVIRDGKIANYHPYPPTPWNGSVRGLLRNARAVRGRGPEHADLRGEPTGPVQGHRHHARGPQLRPVPAVRRAHVRRQRDERRPTCTRPRIAVKPTDMDRHDVQALSERIDVLLDEVQRRAEPEMTLKVEELVRAVLSLHGAGLEQLLNLLDEPQVRAVGRGRPGRRDCCCCTTSTPTTSRPGSRARSTRVRPYLGSHAGGIDYLGIDDDGVVHLRLQGSCEGCPGSTATVRLTVENAVLDAAPEAVAVDVEGMVEAEADPADHRAVPAPPGRLAPAGPGHAARPGPAPQCRRSRRAGRQPRRHVLCLPQQLPDLLVRPAPRRTDRRPAHLPTLHRGVRRTPGRACARTGRGTSRSRHSRCCRTAPAGRSRSRGCSRRETVADAAIAAQRAQAPRAAGPCRSGRGAP